MKRISLGDEMDYLVGLIYQDKRFDVLKASGCLRMTAMRICIIKNRKKQECKHFFSLALGLSDEDFLRLPRNDFHRLAFNLSTLEALEMIENMCSLLRDNLNLIACSTECPSELVVCVSSLIYCAVRFDLPELRGFKTMIQHHCGDKFVDCAASGSGEVVDQLLVRKLRLELDDEHVNSMIIPMMLNNRKKRLS